MFKSDSKPIKVAFLDRDGALIFEPQDDFKIDSLEKLRILDGVIEGLQKLVSEGYMLVMVTNQDGIGTENFTEEEFEIPQNEFLRILKENGIEFYRVFVCPHLAEDNCNCRKPKTALVSDFLKQENIDYENSFMYGDRLTDGEFAKNIGVRFIKTETNNPFRLKN